MTWALFIGFLFGFVGSMPVAGPIAILVFDHGVNDRFRRGLLVALGGTLGESLYVVLAVWGFSTFLAEHAFIVPVSRALGAVVLFVLGVLFARPPRAAKPKDPAKTSHAGDVMLGLTVTALNPTLIVTWSAAVTSMYATGLIHFDGRTPLGFPLGAGAGIVSWYVVLLSLLRHYRTRFKAETLERVVRFMGWFLIGLSFYFAWLFVAWLLESA